MKTEEMIFENVLQKYAVYKRQKAKRNVRIFSSVGAFVLALAISLPLIFRNENKNFAGNSQSDSQNSQMGLATSDVPYIISTEEFYNSINAEGFTALTVREDKITNISNIFNTEYNCTHYMRVGRNTRDEYWIMDYYYYGFEINWKYCENYRIKQNITFNGVSGVVAGNEEDFKRGGMRFYFDFGGGKGISVYYANLDKVDVFEALNKIFVQR